MLYIYVYMRESAEGRCNGTQQRHLHTAHTAGQYMGSNAMNPTIHLRPAICIFGCIHASINPCAYMQAVIPVCQFWVHTCKQ
jgi:hypothetical protein